MSAIFYSKWLQNDMKLPLNFMKIDETNSLYHKEHFSIKVVKIG